MPINRERLALRAFNRKRVRLGEDFCDLIEPTEAPDGFGGSTLTSTEVASDLLCFYEPLGGSSSQVAGGALTTQTHRVTMEATAASLTIKSDYKIQVRARDERPAITFEDLIPLLGSFAPLVEVAAKLRMS